MAKERLIYLPLGGAGEIGMNMYVYGYGHPGKERLIVVDAGVSFPDMDNTPGVKLIMADFDWLIERDTQVEAIFLTHGHLDHVGAIPFLAEYFDVPMYARPFSIKVAEARLLEHGVIGDNLQTINDPSKYIEAGPFSVRFLPISHSIPESSALVIDTPEGRIIHTGDFKIDQLPIIGDPFDPDAVEEESEVEVIALVCDSTNVLEDRNGRSESSISENILELITRCKGLVVATTFASHIARVYQFAKIAEQCQRSVLLLGNAIERMVGYAVETNVIPDLPNVVSLAQAKNIPRHKLLVLATGSQGEPRAATAQLARGTLFKGIQLKKGDTVIYSSKTIPGNEKLVGKIKNKFAALGVDIIDEPSNDYHVSGHPPQGDLEEIHQVINPNLIIPMHGEYRHLSTHAEVAQTNGFKSVIAPNGTMVNILTGSIIADESFNPERIYLDGHFLIGSQNRVVLNRLKMARNGCVKVSLLLKGNVFRKNGLKIQALGLTDMGMKDLRKSIHKDIAQLVKTFHRRINSDDTEIVGKIEKITQRLTRSIFDKNPLIMVEIFQLDE